MTSILFIVFLPLLAAIIAGFGNKSIPGVVAKGDLIVLSYGDKMGQSGGTNTISIVRVGEPQVATKR